jgi:hypothetical protein
MDYKKVETDGSYGTIGLYDWEPQWATAAGKLRSEGAAPSPVFPNRFDLRET